MIVIVLPDRFSLAFFVERPVPCHEPHSPARLALSFSTVLSSVVSIGATHCHSLSSEVLLAILPRLALGAPHTNFIAGYNYTI